jgi:hypothetical protein
VFALPRDGRRRSRARRESGPCARSLRGVHALDARHRARGRKSRTCSQS